MIYDRNPAAKLVLDEYGYLTMSEDDATVELPDTPLCYLDQRHYCARATPAGLHVSVAPLLPGWEKLESLEWQRRLRNYA